MRRIAWTFPLLLVPVVAGASLAAEPDRYRLERTPDGYVRMDTRTGALSLCVERSGDLVCKASVEEPVSPAAEIDRLRAEVSALQARVEKLENSLAARVEKSLPTEEDFNRTMGYMERFFRSFMAIVKDFEADEGKPAEPQPGKT